jgi:hypothetical protein
MKNIFLKIVVLAISIFIAHEKGNAQTNVKIMDLLIIPTTSQDSIVNDSVELTVHFKINKPGDATKVHFWLGTVIDNFDIFSATPIFNTNGNVSYLAYSGNSNEVKNYLAVFSVKISKAYYTNLLKATLFVETNTGQFTNRLYY